MSEFTSATISLISKYTPCDRAVAVQKYHDTLKVGRYFLNYFYFLFFGQKPNFSTFRFKLF